MLSPLTRDCTRIYKPPLNAADFKVKSDALEEVVFRSYSKILGCYHLGGR